MAQDKTSGEKSHPPSQYPESIEFSGVGRTSLLQVHISAALIIVVGVIIAIRTAPAGFLLLIVFLVFVLGVEMWMIRRSFKEVRITLFLRKDPVEASQSGTRIGDIDHGSIEPEMENANELGYRPAPNKNLLVWVFDSEEDKKTVERRLLEYLPRDDQDRN